MENERIVETFEAYFEKYKKTEGDMSSWSAFWTVYSQGHSFEINLTKCPRGTRFKIFSDRRKIGEIVGWPAFLDSLEGLEKAHPAFKRSDFFGQMAEML